MVGELNVAMKIDPSFEAPTPTTEFNSVAQVEMNNPQAQVAHNVNAAPVDPGFSASMSFQMAANFQETLVPEHGPQEVTALYDPELMQGVENASYALQTAQLSGGSWLTDSLNVAMTAMDNVAGIKQEIAPTPVVQVEPEPVMKQTWTPSPGMGMSA